MLITRSTAFSLNPLLMKQVLDVAVGRDPYEFRAELLQDNPRHLAVLTRAAEEADWSRDPALERDAVAAYRCRNPATSFGSLVAQVVEVTVTIRWAALRRQGGCV